MAVSGPRPRGIRVRTAHAAEAEFIAAFHELCDEATIFAPTDKMKPVGVACAFSLELADGTPMVRGLGMIRNAWPVDDSPFGQPGIHIEIEQLTSGTEPIFDRLLAARTAALAVLAANAPPRTRPAPSTHRLWAVTVAPSTEQTAAVSAPDDEPEAAELPVRITRELRAPNPPQDLTADAIEESSVIVVGTPPPTPPPPIPRARAGTHPGFPPVTTSTSMRPLVEPPSRPSQPPAAGRASAADIDAALAASRPRPWWMSARIAAVFAAGLGLGILTSLAIRPQRERVIVQTVPAAAPVVAPSPLAAADSCTQPLRASAASVMGTANAATPGTSLAASAPRPSSSVSTPLSVSTPPAAAPATQRPATAPTPTEAARVTPTATARVTPTATAPTAAAAPKAKPARAKKHGGCSSLDCI